MKACEQCGEWFSRLTTIERKTPSGNVRLQVCTVCAGHQTKAMPDLLSAVLGKLKGGRK